VAEQIQSPRTQAIRRALDLAAVRLNLESHVRTMQAQLRDDPGRFGAAEELILIHLTEFNDPAQAATYLPKARDETLRRIADWAAQPID